MASETAVNYPLSELQNNTQDSLLGFNTSKRPLITNGGANNGSNYPNHYHHHQPMNGGSSSPQAENSSELLLGPSDSMVLETDGVHVEFRHQQQTVHLNNNINNGRVKSLQVDDLSPVGEHEQQVRRRRRHERRAQSAAVATTPITQTTQTALVAELKDVLRRKSKFVEVVPDRNNQQGLGSYDDIADGYDDEEYSNDDGDVDYDEAELRRLHDDGELSPEERGRNASSSPFLEAAGGDLATSRSTPLNYARTVRCVVVGDNTVEICTSLQSSRRCLDVNIDGALVNLQIVGVVGVENNEELGRFSPTNQNADVFLAVFNDEQNLRGLWLPNIRRANSKVPVVICGPLAAQSGLQVAGQTGAADYVEAPLSGESPRPLVEALVRAVVSPRPPSSSLMPPQADAGRRSISPADNKKGKKGANKCCCTIS